MAIYIAITNYQRVAPDEMIHIFLKWLDHLLNVMKTTMFLAFVFCSARMAKHPLGSLKILGFSWVILIYLIYFVIGCYSSEGKSIFAVLLLFCYFMYDECYYSTFPLGLPKPQNLSIERVQCLEMVQVNLRSSAPCTRASWLETACTSLVGAQRIQCQFHSSERKNKMT